MIRAKKSLGQNFLTDEHYINKIACDCIGDNTGSIVEIGCGTGNLTKKLIELTDLPIHGIEIDASMTHYLNDLKSNHDNFTYEIADASKIDYATYKNATVVGNLPYNVGSKIIIDCVRAKVKRIVFLLQAEVVDRIVASTGSSDYGGISVLVQSYYSAKSKYCISPNSFNPRPSVKSRLLICDLLENVDIDFEQLSKLLRIAFQYPRKTLANNVGNYVQIDDFDKFIRPGQVSAEMYAKLLKKHCNT